jgi:G3E family GTPase
MSNSKQNSPRRSHAKPRFIMIGGFLGAGKTTAIGKLAAWLSAQGLRPGLITNDQGRNLVDTAILRSQGFPTEEVPGGCFCCRFNSLMEASEKLRLEQRPDALIAEAVGSCTDLVATVANPLRLLHGDDFSVAPVSVLVDPFRAEQVFGPNKQDGFSEGVLYIYKKQLEEADLIVISKSDVLDTHRLDEIRQAIASAFPHKEILAASSRTGANLEAWFSRLLGESAPSRKAVEVDYEIYADGEAKLGWLNCTVNLTGQEPFSAEDFLPSLTTEIQSRLKARKAEIAHLKMAFTSPAAELGVTVANLARSDATPQISMHSAKPAAEGWLTINLRAEAAPDILGAAMREGLAAAAAKVPHLSATLDHLEHFRPGKPMPTHRIVELAASK